MKNLLIIFLLFGFCIYLICYSRDLGLVAITLPTLIIIASLITIIISGWFEGTYWQAQTKAAKIAFPYTALIFLLGYFYVILRAIILKAIV